MSIHELVAAVIWNNEASLKIIAGMMDKPQWESGTTPRLRFLGHHLLSNQGNVFSCACPREVDMDGCLLQCV